MIRQLIGWSIPPSAPQPAFGPGRKHSMLPALAKNMPPAYFLNASRPLHKGGFFLSCHKKTRADLGTPKAPFFASRNPAYSVLALFIYCYC